MRILLTNDDGFDAWGLQALASALNDHELWVVAPDRDRSGASQSITLDHWFQLRWRGERRVQVDGTPADCVRVAVQGVLPAAPDLVIAGINHGVNVGTDVLLSGTVSAVRQAALFGLRRVALSCHDPREPAVFGALADLVRRSVDRWSALLEPGRFLSVNVPGDRWKGIKLVRPGQLPYSYRVESAAAGLRVHTHLGPSDRRTSQDWRAVSDGWMAVTPFDVWGPSLRGRRGLALWAEDVVQGRI